MRIEKWGYLLSYVIYLVFCICFSIFSEDVEAINSMVFAITIASTAFSISDLFFTKLDIDKKEMESLYRLYNSIKKAEKFCINNIEVRYGKEAEKMISMLMEVFEENEDEIINFFEEKLSPQEKENFMSKVRSYSNNELTEFVMNYLQSDNSDIKEMIFEDEDANINEIMKNYKKKELINYRIASIIAVLGLTVLLVILTLRISAMSYVINTLTVVAFLSIIINLLLKEYYKANSLKNIENERKQLIDQLKLHNNS